MAIPVFTKEFNERTKNDIGLIIPVVITVYADRTFSFITKTPPAPVLILKACGIEKGSSVPNKTKVAKLTRDQVRKIAETKMPDLNAASIESAMSTSRSRPPTAKTRSTFCVPRAMSRSITSPSDTSRDGP